MDSNCSIVLVPKGHYRAIAQQNWGLSNEQMKGMHVHHRIPRSKGGTDAPENLYVCSPSFHANVWHSGYYRIIQEASEVARLGGIARQKKGLTGEGLAKMREHGHNIGLLNKEKSIGLFARDAEKRSADARKAGKLGIKTTLARNPDHMREMGLRGGAPGKNVIVTYQGSQTLFKSISKAIRCTGVSRARAYNSLRDFGSYQENDFTLTLL